VPMLSEYMGEMVPLIRSHNGYVNKFLGDGIMFFFNAPYPNTDHAADAVKSVLDMQRAMGPFNEKLKSQGLPTLNMRVGIVSGEMVVGDAGPENASDYTVLGDNVNLASRLEGANKATGTNTMIHWRTKELMGDRFLCRPIGRLMVKGKTEGVMTFEPMGPTVLADDRQRRMVEWSEKIVNAYFAADFDACIAACDEMDKELGASKYTKLYRKEAEHRKEEFKNDGEHVKNFAGVITLSEK
jgi:adenylate cyclase